MARTAPGSAPDPAHPLAAALLPPASLHAAEAFAEPFFRFADLPTALADLRLPSADAATVAAAFVWFQKPLDRLCAEVRAQRPEVALAAVGRWAKLDTFLARFARFYGVLAQVPHRLSVDVVWSPDDRIRATAWAGRAIVPFNRYTFRRDPGAAGVHGFERATLSRTLGVVVHEFGHVFASLLPNARRQALTDRIAGEVGVLNLRHPNVMDEAVQTAAGNVLFLRSLPAWVGLDAILYAHESGQPWPAAIDRLARHLAPVLARHLATPSGFDGPFLDEALRLHAAVFGRPPVAFSRACIVLSAGGPAGDPAIAWWRRLMPGMNRRAVGSHELAAQRRWLTRNPWLSRWLMTTVSRRDPNRAPSGVPIGLDAAGRAPPMSSLRGVDSEALDAAAACVRTGAAACFVARRRGSAAGWDLALAATDFGGLRRLLGRLIHRRSLATLRLAPAATPAAAPSQ